MVCPQCGNLRSVCSDPSVDWHPHVDVCYATGAQEWAVRRLRKMHEKTEPGEMAMHPLDGVSVFPSTIEPEGDADPFA